MNKFISVKVKVWKAYLFMCCFLLSFGTATIFGQSFTVSGTVTDETGDTMPGVNVVVKGTTVGAATNNDGTYRISVSGEDAVLQFSFIGYIPVEITVGSQRIINVELTEDAQQLEEVVVIGYGEQSRASITSSIVNVSTDELLRSPTTSLGNTLTGRLPGLSSIQYSGLPGYDDPSIFVRGVGTLNQWNSSPLILVDGVERSFTQIDPNEIANISILKDAGATAVFGVRGANGVILVTTKRGEVGKARVSVSGSFGVQQPTKMLKFADSYTYAYKYREAERGDGYEEHQMTFSAQALEYYRTGEMPVLFPSIDWMSYIMEKYALQNQYNINVSGGNDNAKYFVSVGRTFQDGMFNTFSLDPRENFKYERYNYRANLDVNMTKTTQLSVSLGGRIENRNGPNDNNSEPDREGNIFRYLVEANPMSSAGIVDGKYITYSPEVTPIRITKDGLNQHYARGYRNEVTNVLNFDLTLTQKLDFITTGLDIRAKGSYNNRFVLGKTRGVTGDRPGCAIYRPIPQYEADGVTIIGYELEKVADSQTWNYNEWTSYGRDWYFDLSLNYRRKFAASHNVSGLLLYNQSKRYYAGGGYDDIPRGYIGLVGRLTYDYQMKYLLDLNIGYNGSENFAEGKRYGLFPAVSVGWVLSEEAFMKSQSHNIIDYLKIRYSIGLVGNDMGVGRFVYLPASYSTGPPPRAAGAGNGTNFGSGTTNPEKGNVSENSLGNPNVSWEKARKHNVGIDVRTLRNRLGLNFDMFKERRYDILVNTDATIPIYFALPNNPPINYGIVDNWGYELSLSWSERKSNFSYTISPNISFSRNKRVEFLEEPRSYDYLLQTGTKVGQPFNREFFGFYYEGIEEDYVRDVPRKYGGKFPALKDGTNFPVHTGYNLKPGDAVYVDLNNDGKIDNEDVHAIGFPDYPEYTFGLNMSFRYKRWELSMLWNGATNVNRSLGQNFQYPFMIQNNGALIQWVADNSWTETNQNAELPRITFVNRDNNIAGSSIYLRDTSYARLKNLEIGYNVNVSALPYLTDARLYVSGYNLITITGYKANDPETSSGGGYFRYPPLRIFTIGFRVSF